MNNNNMPLKPSNDYIPPQNPNHLGNPPQPNMGFCGQCGAKAVSNSKFCGSCGGQVSMPPNNMGQPRLMPMPLSPQNTMGQPVQPMFPPNNNMRMP